MNLFDSSFLCLDIGTSGVRGIAHRVRSGQIDRSAVCAVDNYDTVFALKSVIDELETKIGTHFDSAYITGNFGDAWFTMVRRETLWNGEHRIGVADVNAQIAQITPPAGFYPMHIVPMRYDGATSRNMPTPIGVIERRLASVFGAIFYEQTRMDEIVTFLRRAHIQPAAFFDASFLINSSASGDVTMILDFGAEFTTASVWTARGPVWHHKFAHGGTHITREIADKMGVGFDDAERIKRTVASMIPKEMDRFTPADTAYDFSRSDVNDIVVPHVVDIVGQIKAASATALTHYKPARIIVTGGGSECEGVCDLVENMFAIPVQNMHSDAAVRALSDYIWAAEEPHRRAYLARSERMRNRMARLRRIFSWRRRRARPEFVPVMPSTLCFDMRRDDTYSLFRAGGVSLIHVDIMDGFYVDRIAGGIDELKYIRAHTNAHLHVHLMTEGPVVWAKDAIAAGANTIIVSTNTAGVRTALRNIRAAGVRAGVALHPDSAVTILKPILREIDEVMVMAVAPGAAGQSFNPECLHKIAVLAATRKKYGLKFTISVDGGVNDKTAQMCWDAGADLLVSGSYLARATDFPLALRGLMRGAHS